MKTVVSHQTVRLSTGSHDSPDSGVCVMELASMLAGEEFSDKPRSVCAILGTILRAYNDQVDDARRQDLYEFASRAVATAGPRCVRRHRAREALRFFAAARPAGRTRRSPLALLFPELRRDLLAHATARYATDVDDSAHREMLELLDRLMDARPPAVPLSAAEAGVLSGCGGA